MDTQGKSQRAVFIRIAGKVMKVEIATVYVTLHHLEGSVFLVPLKMKIYK